MKFFTTLKPVKAARHKVPPPVFLHQPALTHCYSRGLCHQVVRILNRAISIRVFQLFVFVARHTVKFKQPVFKSIARRDLA